jgi:hypothetical protein
MAVILVTNGCAPGEKQGTPVMQDREILLSQITR